MPNKTVWIDRGWQPVAIGFVPSEKAWNKTCKAHKIDALYPEMIGSAGYTVYLQNDKTGEGIILVCVNKAAERDPAEVVLTIVHEAVHVWQFVCRQIGEKSPGIEIEAYGIEAISRGLIEAYTATQGKGRVW